MKRREWLVRAAGAAAAAVAGAAQAAQTIAWPALRLIDGSTLAPEAWQGRAGIVVFWATWCGYCERHGARIEQLHRSLQGRGPRILGACIDGDDASVGRLARARGWSFPVAVDSVGLRARFTARRVVPMTCLVDASGTLKLSIPGEMAEDDVMGLPRSLAA
ncbi:MAG: TlpA family protein disulfide reductase [Rubrivivax sp.]|jgi:thiol-disulfide isomerase/thioredoxin|nr:TlpA family protein disulfide reductase [Rubrivivax sp.]